ncbi:MAG: hypothetical protein JXR96_29760 [Deltaproteobacteria bacterium]|nr:hypothetical protein [Deltaproteobacteria bacterium]
MSLEREITFADLERALSSRDPLFADLVVRYLALPDPPEDRPELPPDDDQAGPGERQEHAPLPEGAWTLDKLRRSLHPDRLASKTDAEKKALRTEAWKGLLQAPHPPPRLRLGDLLIGLYELGDEWSRSALMEIFGRARLGFGIWKAFKTIYKLSELRHDAAFFGLLAWRLDAIHTTATTGEIGRGTLLYMRRRAWRYLRQLGLAVPEIYPQFAAQVLRHYPRGAGFHGSWVANQIWCHADLIGSTSAWMGAPPSDLKKRAFEKAWKQSPEPLLRLLEDAQNDHVCDFAIRSLDADFPDELRKVDAAWLARIGRKPLASVHRFVVRVMSDSPDFHQSKLAGLGLHDMVVGLLESDSPEARKYAVDYARAHAEGIDQAFLIRLAEEGQGESQLFAVAQLDKRSPAELGLPALVRLLAVGPAREMAAAKISAGFSPDDLDAELYIQLASGSSEQQGFVKDFFKQAGKAVPARLLTALVDDERCSYYARREAMQELGKRKGEEIGVEWIKKALMEDQLSHQVAGWLRAGKLKGAALDVDWVKGLVMRPSLRALAIELLGNRKLTSPSQIGLAWLLTMARQTDEALQQFAHRYLLEFFAPEDFAREMGSADAEQGIDRLWKLASGPKEPEPVRAFAAMYLKLHHPELGPSMAESRSLGIQPRLARESYTLERVRPLFADPRPDVRRLAAAVGRHEIVRWGDPALLYEIAASRHRESRQLAAEVLLAIGQPDADPARVPSKKWLTAQAVFALAESPVKPAREVALTIVRRHYEMLGGAERLAWLMESPDREVRLFAVRLLWERHRPRPLPEGWQPPRTPAEGLAPVGGERFRSDEALRLFMRTVLFGLPPGRMERRDAAAGPLPDRPLPASVAKRRLIGVVRDLALEEADFAAIAVPVLGEFMHSRAKGEWQGCLTALARIRRRHPSMEVGFPGA